MDQDQKTQQPQQDQMYQTLPPQPQRIIVTSTKNVGLAVGLALFLGPLGMCYSTLKGALVMFLVNIVIAVLTLGFGCLITLPFCAIWAYMAAKKYNEQLLAEQQ